MSRPLVDALRRRPLARPPVWVMRQAGRYLPEYRELRRHHTFQEAVATPAVAAEITLQPIRRFGMDGAVIFADIMTPLEAMGVEMTFDPGPRLRPHSLAEVAALGELDLAHVDFVAETIRRVRADVPDEVAVIGFAGAPVTLLAYLIQGGGSKDFMAMRGALRADPALAAEALEGLAVAMQRYLAMQAEAGVDAVQLFDTWSGLLGREQHAAVAVPAARRALRDLAVPRIYFAPGAGHSLAGQSEIGAEGYGVDWRVPLDEAWDTLGDVALQGNLDPAVLLGTEDEIRSAVAEMRRRVAGRAGYVANLGHGIDRHTPPEHVAAFVEAVRA